MFIGPLDNIVPILALKMGFCHWESWKIPYYKVPEFAVQCNGSAGNEVFVGRVKIKDKAGSFPQYLPAEIDLRMERAYYSYGGDAEESFQFCCMQNPIWRVENDLHGAVVGGCNKTGENYYIGRVLLNKCYYIGTVDPRIDCLTIVDDGGVISFTEYEVLCAEC